ncbi:MAG: EAL domain-containing protein [Pseudomonadota bacterium]
MNFKSKLYIALAASFSLLFFSLFLNIKSIGQANEVIEQIETKQLKLFYLSFKLSNDIALNQANTIYSIMLNNKDSINTMQASFEKLKDMVSELDTFIQKRTINIDGIEGTIDIIKNRMAGYIAVEKSLVEAINSQDKVDIEDALIGYNSITMKFSDDVEILISLINNHLKENIKSLKERNDVTQKDILLTFFLASFLILLSIYKLFELHRNIKTQLTRVETAEKEQHKLQELLLQYNNDLEAEITKKTQEIHHKMYTHSITELPNRYQLLEDTYEHSFRQMALLNIDKFQKFNDVYGEEIGNIALKLSGEFLSNYADDENTFLYHIGGDEFVLAVKNYSNIYDTYFIAKIENILKEFAEHTFFYEDKKFSFNISSGIAFSGRKKMLAYADMALKDAKKKNIHLSLYNDDKGLEKLHKDDIECHRRLMYSFETNNVLSYFQPIVPLQDTGKTTKFESLVRIRGEDGKIIPPISFIHVAKANRVYDKLTECVVNNTLAAVSKHHISASINISMEDIENNKTLQMLYTTFDAYEYNHLLTIELLETEEIKDYEKVSEFCTQIRSYGIKLALDDFGAGYSNFSHILNLPVDYIKIDSSLISNIDRNEHSRIMVETIVALAKRLHVETIAEYVSSARILEVVTSLGVDYAQGYHLGKPELIEEYIEGVLLH